MLAGLSASQGDEHPRHHGAGGPRVRGDSSRRGSHEAGTAAAGLVEAAGLATDLAAYSTLGLNGLRGLVVRLQAVARDALAASRCRLFLKLQQADRPEVLWTVAHDGTDRRVSLSADAGLAGACARTGEALVLADASADARFRPDLDLGEGGGEVAASSGRPAAVLCVPILAVPRAADGGPPSSLARPGDGAHTTPVGVLLLARLAETGPAPAGFTASDLAQARALAALVSVAMLSIKSVEDERGAQARFAALGRLAALLGRSRDGSALLRAIQAELTALLQCDTVTVFLVDARRRELRAPCASLPQSQGLQILLPLDTPSLVGSVALTGVRVDAPDVYLDSRFNHAVDQKTGYRTRQILAVPVLRPGSAPTGGAQRVAAVIEAINKADVDDTFDGEDAALMEAFAAFTAVALAAVDLPQGGDTNEAGRSPAGENAEDVFGLSASGAGASPRSPWEERAGVQPQAGELAGISGREPGSAPGSARARAVVSAPWRLWRLDPALAASVPRAADGLIDVLPLAAPRAAGRSASELPFVCWDFDAFQFTRPQLANMVVDVFDLHGLPQAFAIPRRQLERFATAVADAYHDNPYHNFQHGFHVMQVTSMVLLSVPDMNRFLSRVDVLALLVAAISHDLDHPGLTNAFQINSLSPLALRYNDESVLEHHHASTLFHILRDGDANILEGLDRAEFFAVRKLICASILGTDMASHFKLMSAFAAHAGAPWDRKNLQDRQLLLTLLLHAADLSNATQRFEHARVWADALGREFLNQTILEKKLGLPVLPFMEGGSSPAKEINFIQTFAGPLWAALAGLFPQLRHLADNVQATLAAYRRMQEEAAAAAAPPVDAAPPADAAPSEQTPTVAAAPTAPAVALPPSP